MAPKFRVGCNEGQLLTWHGPQEKESSKARARWVDAERGDRAAGSQDVILLVLVAPWLETGLNS